MYIEFSLPTGVGGFAASICNQLLNKAMHDWADRYDVPYNKKLHKYTIRITFDNEQHYTLFTLTWNPDPNINFFQWLNTYKLVEPMKVDRYR